MSCHTFPAWSVNGELSVERRKAVKASSDMVSSEMSHCFSSGFVSGGVSDTGGSRVLIDVAGGGACECEAPSVDGVLSGGIDCGARAFGIEGVTIEADGGGVGGNSEIERFFAH